MSLIQAIAGIKDTKWVGWVAYL